MINVARAHLTFAIPCLLIYSSTSFAIFFSSSVGVPNC
jgi:hypothetical protein